MLDLALERLQRLQVLQGYTNNSKDASKGKSDVLGRFAQVFKPARLNLENAIAPVALHLRKLEQQIVDLIPHESKTAHEVIHHTFGAGGKRIRPALYFLCCDLVHYSDNHLYPMAAVPEMVHTASLLHDDVIDNSAVRRNKPTARSLWGDQAAILVGDLIYARASELMAATGSQEIVALYAQAIRLMSEGELLQLEQAFNPALDEAAYLRIIECKTASLIAASCKSAAILANCSQDQQKALARFGNAVGMAFQLIDDALDYRSTTQLFGKPVLADLLEGKVTMPVLLVAKLGKPEEIARIRSILNQEKLSDTHILEIAALVKKYDTVAGTIEIARTYTSDATQALQFFEDSPSKSHLASLAAELTARFS